MFEVSAMLCKGHSKRKVIWNQRDIIYGGELDLRIIQETDLCVGGIEEKWSLI